MNRRTAILLVLVFMAGVIGMNIFSVSAADYSAEKFADFRHDICPPRV